MKAWLPYKKIELQSNLSADESMHRLSSSIKPAFKRSIFKPFMPDGLFHGAVTSNHFEMKRDEYMNSVVISGTINSSSEGSLIEVVLKPSAFSAPLYCSIAAVAVLFLFLQSAFIALLPLLFIIIFGLYKKLGKPALDALLAVGTIAGEEKEAKKFFYAILNAKEIATTYNHK
jgi:hypothetical protein